MSIHPRAALLLLAVTGVAACGDFRDSGPVVSENREVGSFEAVDIKGAARLEITVGEPESVVLEGHEEVVERLETSVEGDTLHIRSKSRDWIIGRDDRGLTVRLSVPQLKSLRLEGGHDVHLRGFDGGASRIDAEGAVNMRGEGRLDELEIRMSGAGKANLAELVVADAKVTVDGVGSVVVYPTDELDATMNGVGAIHYIGEPRKVITHMNGLGTIGQSEEGTKRDRERRDREPEESQRPLPEETEVI